MTLLSSLVEQRLGETVIFLYDIKLLDEAGIYATGIINVDLTRQCYSTLSLNVMLQVKKWSFPISPRDLLPFQTFQDIQLSCIWKPIMDGRALDFHPQLPDLICRHLCTSGFYFSRYKFEFFECQRTTPDIRVDTKMASKICMLRLRQ